MKASYLRNEGECILKNSVEAIVFDWAGTTVDYGCQAPMKVFAEIFNERGITITTEEIKAPMGLSKWDHIHELCQLESIQTQWRELYGQAPEKKEVDELYARFEPLLFANLRSFSRPIDGVVDVVSTLRDQGIKIGSTSGYTKEMLDVVADEAAKHGYIPDIRVTSEKVGKGRPYPFMCFENAIQLEIDGMYKMVKVGDTVSDIKEGISAGMWSVGVILGSNLLGFSENELKETDENVIQQKIETVREKFYRAGAHFVLTSIEELPRCIDEINQLLQEGIFPRHPLEIKS